MQINKLEVKNISHYARGSEETPCYNATVYINGKKAIDVSNDGHGGCDRQNTHPNIEERGLVQLANEWCVKTFGQGSFNYTSDGKEKTCTYDIDLEHHCHDELYKWLDTKQLKKEMKNQYICIDEDKVENKQFLVAWKRKGNHMDDYFKNFLKKEQPHMEGKCLNFLPFDDALKLYKEYA